jgi:hypothetical protein
MTFQWLVLVGLTFSLSAVGKNLPAWPREGQAQLCNASYASLLHSLEATNKEIITVSYFDTPSRQAQKRGVYVRLRIRENVGEVTLKYRSPWLSRIPTGADCEIDVTREQSMPSCSWKIEVPRHEAQAVMQGLAPVSTVLSKTQEDMLHSLMDTDITRELKMYGPVKMERWKIPGTGHGPKWRLEKWDIGHSMPIYEINYREGSEVSPREISRLQDTFIQRKQLYRCESEISKTDRVLDAFGRPL